MWLAWTLLACVGFGLGAALQKHGVAGAAPRLDVRTVLRHPLRIARTLLARRVWLTGVLVNLAG